MGYRSVRPALGKMLINIDVTSTVVYVIISFDYCIFFLQFLELNRHKSGPLIGLCLDFLGQTSERTNLRVALSGQNLKGTQLSNLSRFVKGRKVTFNKEHPLSKKRTSSGRTRTNIIEGIEILSADEYTFEKDGARISVTVCVFPSFAVINDDIEMGT